MHNPSHYQALQVNGAHSLTPRAKRSNQQNSIRYSDINSVQSELVSVYRMIHPRVQSEKQGQWMFPILSSGVGWLPEKSGGRQLLLTLHIHKSKLQYFTYDAMESDILDIASHSGTHILVNVINRPKGGIGNLGVDRPKGDPSGWNKKDAAVGNGTKTQSPGGCLDADISPRYAIPVRLIGLDAWLIPTINHTTERVGNQIHSHMNLV